MCESRKSALPSPCEYWSQGIMRQEIGENSICVGCEDDRSRTLLSTGFISPHSGIAYVNVTRTSPTIVVAIICTTLSTLFLSLFWSSFVIGGYGCGSFRSERGEPRLKVDWDVTQS